MDPRSEDPTSEDPRSENPRSEDPRSHDPKIRGFPDVRMPGSKESRSEDAGSQGRRF